MKRIKLYVALMAIIMVFVSGCGKKDEAVNNIVEETEATETDEAVNEDSAPIEKPSEQVKDIDSLITEKEDSELDLKEYYYSFEDRTAGSTGDDIFSKSEFEYVGDGFYYETTGKVPLYAPNGVRIGYTKENVDVSVIAACGDWCYFYLDKDMRYARLSDIEANSLGPEELDARSAARMAEEMAKAQPQSQTSAPAEQNSVQETVPNAVVEEPAEVPVESDQYTPEEAIAIYRGILEGGGIIWDPSLKDVSSWGTGFFYLDKEPLEWAGGKSYIEWAGQSSLESFEFGHSFDGSWTRYYLEVTGSDDECVYVTEWHN